MHATFELPWPPSVNHYWRNVGRGRTLVSREGRAFQGAAWAAVHQAGRPTLAGRVSVTITARAKDARRRDLDNLLKATLDALQYARVIEEDSLIDELTVRRGPLCRERPHLIVTVAELDEESDV